MSKSILELYRSPKEFVRLQMNQDIRLEIEELKSKIAQAEFTQSVVSGSMADSSSKVDSLNLDLKDLIERSADTLMTFTFKGMRAKDWRNFTERVKENSEDDIPSDEDLAELVYESLESVKFGDDDSPKPSKEECLAMLTDWTEGDAQALVTAATASNQKSSSVPFG